MAVLKHHITVFLPPVNFWVGFLVQEELLKGIAQFFRPRCAEQLPTNGDKLGMSGSSPLALSMHSSLLAANKAH